MRRRILTIIMMIVLVMGCSITSFAEDVSEHMYEVNDVEKLKKYIANYYEDGKLSIIEKRYLESVTNPDVEMELIAEKMEEGLDELQDVEIPLFEASNGNYYGEYTVELGDGCSVRVELEDVEDVSLMKEFVSDMASMLTPVSHAAKVKTSTVTQAYGNRTLRASFTVICGIGAATLKLDNYYNLSANGISERYGLSYADWVSLMGTVDKETPVITDSVATQPGASDAEMYCQYVIRDSAGDILNAGGTFTITSRLIYDSIDTSNKTITLTHECTKIK